MSNELPLPPDRGALDAWLTETDCLVSPAQMQQSYDRMAKEISAVLANVCPVVLVVMTGGLIAAGEMLRRFSFPLEIDYVHATRYRGTQGGEIEWRSLPIRALTGRSVLIIDDLYDEGVTLAAVRDWCQSAGAAHVWVAVAAVKDLPQRAPSALPEFIGVHLPARFVFGEGMDFDGFFRNLPGIHAVRHSDS